MWGVTVRVERGAGGARQLTGVSMVSMISVLANFQRRLEGVRSLGVEVVLRVHGCVRAVRLHRRPTGSAIAWVAKDFGELAEAVDDILLLHTM